MEHTPTPWGLDKENPRLIRQLIAPGHVIGKVRITKGAIEANARRIVAAVNATAPLKLEVLESLAEHAGGHNLLDGASWKNEATIHAKLNNQAWDKVEQLQAQNARLLEALKRIVYHHDEQTRSTVEYLDFALHAARAAIAEAEKTEPPHTRATII